MTSARALLALALASVGLAACTFAPDYSNYPSCEDGACPPGSTCYLARNICLPDCGEDCPDGAAGPDGGEDGGDAGAEDAGVDAGPTDAGEDLPDGGDGGEPLPDGGLALELLGTTLSPGVEGDPYSHAFSAQGGTPPYAFAAPQGLPPGFALDGGTLEGTCGDAGSASFPVEVRDAADAGDLATVSLTVERRLRLASGGPDDGNPSPITDADVGKGYAEQLHATGYPPEDVTWAPVGTLPSGLTLSSTGMLFSTNISGSGTLSLEAEATLNGDPVQVRRRVLTIQIISVSLGLHIQTASLPTARVGEPYEYLLQSGGTGSPPTWSITSGKPPWMAINSETLVGTPDAPGEFQVEVKAQSGITAHSRTFTLRVDP